MVSGGHTWTWVGWQAAAHTDDQWWQAIRRHPDLNITTDDQARRYVLRTWYPDATPSQLRQMRIGWDRQREGGEQP